MTTFNYYNNHHTIRFSHCPTFAEVREICKAFYVVRDLSAEGCYAIIPELTANGKVNTHI